MIKICAIQISHHETCAFLSRQLLQLRTYLRYTSDSSRSYLVAEAQRLLGRHLLESVPALSCALSDLISKEGSGLVNGSAGVDS
jgi:hypothetical protein